MNDQHREKLAELIREHKPDDNTDYIRDNPRSDVLRNEVTQLAYIRRDHPNADQDELQTLYQTHCPYLYHNHSGVLQSLVQGKVHTDMLHTLLQSLKRVELGELDQHEASFEVGQALKEKYIDKVIPQNDPEKKHSKNISWKHYKQLNQ